MCNTERKRATHTKKSKTTKIKGALMMSDTEKKFEEASELLKLVARVKKIDYALGYLNGMADTEAMHQAKAEKNA